MPERKIKVPMPDGKEVDAVDVPVSESNERWTEITLEDGTVVRLKMTVISVARIEGQYDAEGNPAYLLKSTPTVTIVSVPEHLRKKVQ